MQITQTSIVDLFVVKTTPIKDDRGAFTRFHCDKELASIIGNRHIVQINHSCTRSTGTVRGMHYQRAPHAEMKIVRCLRGRVWDVAIDLRQGSKTFLQWYAQELSPDNALMMVIPEGCAHGFQVLEADSELLYFHTAAYNPSVEGGVRYDDPSIGITWHLPVTELSFKDRQHQYIDHSFQGLKI